MPERKQKNKSEIQLQKEKALCIFAERSFGVTRKHSFGKVDSEIRPQIEAYRNGTAGKYRAPLRQCENGFNMR